MRYFIDARIIVLSAVAVFFISASPVCAQTQKGVKNASGGTDKFAAADTNGDGVISKKEWKGSDEEFLRRDLDNSGSLSRYEFYQNLMPGNLN
jgi:hypothetical protein